MHLACLLTYAHELEFKNTMQGGMKDEGREELQKKDNEREVYYIIHNIHNPPGAH
jgi:hypothetical protein